jgi:hypothetical protein
VIDFNREIGVFMIFTHGFRYLNKKCWCDPDFSFESQGGQTDPHKGLELDEAVGVILRVLMACSET